jgi:hypothetical protein
MENSLVLFDEGVVQGFQKNLKMKFTKSCCKNRMYFFLSVDFFSDKKASMDPSANAELSLKRYGPTESSMNFRLL